MSRIQYFYSNHNIRDTPDPKSCHGDQMFKDMVILADKESCFKSYSWVAG